MRGEPTELIALPVAVGSPEAPEVVPRSRQRALVRARSRQRRRRLTGLGILLVAVLLVGVDLVTGRHLTGGSGGHPAPPRGAVASTAASPVAVPQSGSGSFGYAAGAGPTIGTAGQLRHFRVAVENGANQDPAAFASAVEAILADPRGWIGGGDVRFQRVAQSTKSDFTLYLATPATSEKLCAVGGIHTDQFVSCRLPGQVIINLARWLTAIPGYGASLRVYQQFAVNHEVGRELGHGNEACPGEGRPAPVMQEQTLGLKGCVANAWPYLNGKRYTGTPLP